MAARPRSAILLLVLATVVAGCAGGDQADPERQPIDHLLPPLDEFPGWTVVEGPIEYSTDTLYEYLNGGAERYETYGFARLLHTRYQRGDDPLACVTLDVYDMGGELGAFGIYAAGRPVEYSPRKWGAEGYRSGTIAGAYKGAIFVHGEADDDRAELLTMLERLMSRVADRADGAVAPPAILGALPDTNRVAGTERYVPSNLLGHSFLPGGVLASYEVDGRRAVLFFTDLGAESDAVEAAAALRTHFAERGVLAEGGPLFGDDGFRTTDPIFGQATVVRSGTLIAGIQGDLSTEEREGILRRLVAGAV